MFLGIQKIIRKPNLKHIRSFSQVVDEPIVIKENKRNVAKITLNRPLAYNSFDINTVDTFREAIEEAENNPDTKAIILRGKGKAFSSGGDVKYFLSSLGDDATNLTLRRYVHTCYNQIYRNASLQTPLVSFMDGITMGMGAAIAMYGPFRVATEKTKYAMPETNIGLFCDKLSPHYLSRLDSRLGKFITMTGTVLKGEDTLFAGIGTHFVPSERLDQLEDHISNESDLDHRRINSIIQEYSVDENHNPKNHTLNKENMSTIQRCFKFDDVNDIMDALEKDNTEFAFNAIEAISKRSPTVTVMNVENFKRAPELSFIKQMETEITLWFKVAALHDFSEGIRSNILLKQKPKWNPPTIKDVDINSLRQNVYQDEKVFEPTANISYDPTFIPENYFKYILPTRNEVLEAQRDHNLTTIEDTIRWFQTKANHKFGIRQKIESMELN